MNIQDQFTFFGPQLLKEELERYAPKIAAYSKLTQSGLAHVEFLIFSNLTLVSEELISAQSWLKLMNYKAY